MRAKKMKTWGFLGVNGACTVHLFKIPSLFICIERGGMDDRQLAGRRFPVQTSAHTLMRQTWAQRFDDTIETPGTVKAHEAFCSGLLRLLHIQEGAIRREKIRKAILEGPLHCM